MVNTLKVKPAKGDDGNDLIVRDPTSGRVLPGGKFTEVESNTYWRRRVRDGSCIEQLAAVPDEGDEGHATKRKSKAED